LKKAEAILRVVLDEIEDVAKARGFDGASVLIGVSPSVVREELDSGFFVACLRLDVALKGVG
jgi:hypothetical protein